MPEANHLAIPEESTYIENIDSQSIDVFAAGRFSRTKRTMLTIREELNHALFVQRNPSKALTRDKRSA